MNKDGKLSLALKCGCHCTYTNENTDNGNQKVTSECGVSFIYTFLDYDEFCSYEGICRKLWKGKNKIRCIKIKWHKKIF